MTTNDATTELPEWIEKERERIAAGFMAYGLPSYMLEGITEYVLRGRPTGDFLRNLLRDNLSGAVSHADDNNQRALADWCKFLYNHVPAGCKGSSDAHKKWIERGGLIGIDSETK